MTAKITIEHVRVISNIPDDNGGYRPAVREECFVRKPVATYRIFDEDYENITRVAAQMLTAWLHANPGQLGTYIITHLSAREEGSNW